ncbi:hypothetical protein DRW03_11015 [Corallococcus sp. H22C18031201]|uniref:hypothetical protein n=1 Tax=Citreicoccus inhibens TaxID=2849499 RepID=UPI000E712EA4|nr:hypothetical protein [Citreicoccus inhibens]MBU8898754.1 hypothetical protein [Citreicoccus inhibens]RJS24127.1 hypothetical protein DRW03_11015 [Corallococcus sp. H22C18031201]
MPLVPDGYGEFVVIKSRPGHPLGRLSSAEYRNIYQNILHPHSPFHVVHQHRLNVANGVMLEGQAFTAVEQAVRNRATTVQQQLTNRNATIHPHVYGLIFIPRTLYEVMYLNALMEQEETLAAFNQWDLEPMAQYEAAIVDPAVNLAAENVNCSLGMNVLITDKLRPLLTVHEQHFPLSGAQIWRLANPELALFRAHILRAGARQSGFRYLNPVNVASQISLGQRLNGNNPIRTRVDILIRSLRAAMRVEMESAGRLLLYRGTDHDVDSLVGSGGFPISFNTSLFATLVYDPNFNTSTPAFMLENQRTGYCVPIPYQDMVRARFPFHVPLGNSLKQLHGHDQESHAWTKTITTYYNNHLGMLAAAFPATSHLHYMQYHVNNLQTLNTEFQDNYVLRKRVIYKWNVPNPEESSRNLMCNTCDAVHGRFPSLARRWHICDTCSAIYCWACGFRLRLYEFQDADEVMDAMIRDYSNPGVRACRSCEGSTRLFS